LLKRLFILILLVLFSLPAVVDAQGTIELSSLEVDLWPEYDRPSMLVIYHATLPPEVDLPAEVTFRIPARAGNPNAVAIRQPDGSLISVAYDRQVDGKWGQISFTATSPQVQLEYYDSLTIQDEQRHFEYVWPGDYAVENLVIQAQQPFGARDVIFSPGMSISNTGQDGLVYYSTQVGSIEAGNTLTIAMDYNKPDNNLSVEQLQFEVQPSAPLPPDTTGSTDWLRYLPWVLGILGITLIAGGGYWYLRQSKEQQPQAPRRRRRQASPADSEASGVDKGIYCHQCGKRAGPTDRFCRSCGTRLRVE
jgi:hypothetical protein